MLQFQYDLYISWFFGRKKKNFHFPFPLCHLPAVSSQMKELSHLQKCRCILEKGDAAVIQTSKECLDLEKIIKLKEKVVFPVIKIQYISMSVRLVFLFFNKIKTISIWFLVWCGKCIGQFNYLVIFIFCFSRSFFFFCAWSKEPSLG